MVQISSRENPMIALPCLQLDRIHLWLQREVEWSGGECLSGVRLSRQWVGRHGRLTFELAIDLTCDGSLHTVMLQGGAHDPSLPVRTHTRGRVSRRGLRGLRLMSPELGLWCCTPDRDWRLPTVRTLLDEKRAASLLAATAAASILGLPREGARVRCEITAYRVNKRCAFRACATDRRANGGVFVKVFRRPPADEQIEALRRLPSYLHEQSHGRVRVPSFVDSCSASRLLILEDIASPPRGGGRKTEKISPLGYGSDDLAVAAAALAILHSVPNAWVRKVHTPRDEFQTACRWVRALRGLGQRYLRLRELVVELSGLVTPAEGPDRTLVHRDFFASQLLRVGDTLWMLDFDTLSLGHSEVDVATFVAHLFHDGLVADAGMPYLTRQAEGFIEGYLQHGGRMAKSRLQFYLPCALIRLGAIHSARGASPRVVDGLWELAGGYLAGKLRLR